MNTRKLHIPLALTICLLLLTLLGSLAPPGTYAAPGSPAATATPDGTGSTGPQRQSDTARIELTYPEAGPVGIAAATGLFPGRQFSIRVTWEHTNLSDQDLHFRVEIFYPYPYTEYDPVSLTGNQYVTDCTHDEANHQFVCNGVFPKSDPPQDLEGWVEISYFVGTCALYQDPQPTEVTFDVEVTYVEDPGTTTAQAVAAVEPALDLTLLSRSPADGTEDVIIEDENHQGPLLTWSLYYSYACGDGSDPINQDVAYLVGIRKVGGEWRVFNDEYPTCSRQIQLSRGDLACEEKGDPAVYEWNITIADIRYAQCGAITDNIARFTTASCRPEIEVKPRFGDYFLSGLGVDNTYRVEVDWNGGAFEPPPQPPYGKVVFDLNGNKVEEPGQEWGAEHTYNMGADFNASLFGGDNVLRIKAVTDDGYESLEETLQPMVFPLPEWITQFALGNFEIDLQARTVKYAREIEYPNPHFEARYTVPGWVPYLGGADMGIIETYATVGAEACSDGSGTVGLRGNTGVQLTEEQRVTGHISGQGNVRLGPGSGLDLTDATFGLGIQGEIAKEMGIADLVPGLKAAENWWLVGRLVKWFNQRATVEAAIGPEISIETKFRDVNDQLQFRSGTGTGLIDMSLTLALRVFDSLKASITGGGTPRVVVQVPASGPWGYLQEIAIRLYAKAALTVWRFEGEWERGVTCSLPQGTCEGDEGLEGQGLMMTAMGTGTGWRLMGRDYVTDDYATFVANRTTRLMAAQATQETEIVSHVFPLADPALAVRADGERMLLWVHDDDSKPIAQGEEIYAAHWNGTTWITATVTDDNYQDFNPQVAFDADGDAVAVWERTNTVHISPTLNITYARSFEVAAATWNGSSWSAPATLTNDSLMDISPQLERGQDGSLMALWRTSDGTDILGTATHPLTLTYAVWDGSTWSSPAPALTGLTDTLGVDLAVYSATQAALVLARDTDGVLTTTTDTELYYATFDGTNWSGLTPLTSDAITDTAPALGYDNSGQPVIVWLHGDDLVMQTGWSGSRSTVRPGSTSGAFLDFDLLPDPDGNLALLWQAISTDGANLAYAVYDAAHASWGADNTLMDDSALEESFAPAFAADGTLYIAYNKVTMELVTQTVEISPTLTITVTNIPTPVQTDLYLLSHTIGRDLSITGDDVTLSHPNPAPGSSVVISATVHNVGDLAVTGGEVAFYDGDPNAGGTQIGITQTLVSPFRAAATDTVSVTWDVPSGATAHTLYVVVDPAGSIAESDESNNQATLSAVRPDLTVAWAHSTHTSGVVTLTAVVSNGGHLPAGAPFTVAFRAADPLTGTLLGTAQVTGDLAAGDEMTVTLPLADPLSLAGLGDLFWAIADAGNGVAEADEGNNTDYAALNALPDLTLTAADISGSGPVAVTVHNAGVVTATEVVLAVRRNSLTGTLLYSGTLGSLGPGAGSAITFTLPEEQVELWAKADPDNLIAESDETNNLAVRAVEVSSRIYLPLVMRGLR